MNDHTTSPKGPSSAYDFLTEEEAIAGIKVRAEHLATFAKAMTDELNKQYVALEESTRAELLGKALQAEGQIMLTDIFIARMQDMLADMLTTSVMDSMFGGKQPLQ